MALSLKEAVFIAQDSELRFRRPGWFEGAYVKVKGNDLWWHHGSGFTVGVDGICADDYEIVRPDGSVAAMPDDKLTS